MDRLGLARASLVGHSIGGRIAWIFAALHSERVDELVPGARAAMLAFMAQTVLEALPNVKGVAIPGAGHLVKEEAADASVMAAVDFLDK